MPVPAAHDDELTPFDERVVRVEGRGVGVCQWGAREGRPAFMLHGTPGSRLLHHPVSVYVEAGVRVITYDRPGYGLSQRLRGRRVADAARDIEAVAQALRIDAFGVVGISGGGPPALAAAAQLPTSVVRCASVVGMAPPDTGSAWLEGCDERETYARLLQEGLPAAEAQAREEREWVEAGMPGLDVSGYWTVVLTSSFREAFRTGVGGTADDFASLTAPWEVELSAVRCPVVVMAAREDPWSLQHGRQLAARLPHAVLTVVDGGHFGPRDEAERQLLQWVAGVTDTPP